MKFDFPNNDRTYIRLIDHEGNVIQAWRSDKNRDAPEKAIADFQRLLNEAPWWLTIGIVDGFQRS